MDPLESVAKYRQQEAAGGGRTLKIAPPPAIPVAPAPPPADPAGAAPDDTRTPAPADADGDPSGAGGPVGEGRILGNTRGRKQLLYVYLPGPTIQRLDDARPGHGTLGAAVMAALRGSYEWLLDTHTPEPVEAVGPFPAVRGPKRRQGLEEGRLKPFYVDPGEAKGIDALAGQLEMSPSELVTIAIDFWYGDRSPAGGS
ncbi:MAG: hypothetical protein QOE80_4422 [Actinomycetota bacterium]|jgi:hypothetical protein|nr:hypothetical protein [Actinomycetota bacterium]